MKELVAEGIPVAVTCRVLQLARQPYYRWLADPVTAGELAGAYRANALFDVTATIPNSVTHLAAELLGITPGHEQVSFDDIVTERHANRLRQTGGTSAGFLVPAGTR
ncbi:hypothetical protein ACFYTQ_12170 [Nocardia sp. NPDC004068]|uniref:hypothetical protein n=1 Tax=Nocardia sp. NPDC004068 TaxID=3364303 RepID=UPI0036B049D9